MRFLLMPALVFALAGPATAATFDLTGGGRTVGADGSLGLSAPNLNMTVTATDPAGTAAGTLKRNKQVGVEVLTQKGDLRAVDGRGAVEALRFDFSQVVQINSIGFGRVDNNDDVTISTLSPFTGVGTFSLGARDADRNSELVLASLLSAPLVGKSFTFAASGNNDNFSVRSVDVSVVPIPGALAMLLAGLGGLVLVRRRAA